MEFDKKILSFLIVLVIFCSLSLLMQTKNSYPEKNQFTKKQTINTNLLRLNTKTCENNEANRIDCLLVDIWSHLNEISRIVNGDRKNYDLNKYFEQFKAKQRLLEKTFKDLSKINDESISKVSRKVTKNFQKRLYKLQNPKNCETSKRLLCTDHQKCGMGCQLHWVMYCFIAAYNTNRTLIIDKSVLNNYNEEGWNSVFEGVSGNCTSVEGGSVIEWKGIEESKNDLIVEIPQADIPKRPTSVEKIPDWLREQVEVFHGKPPVWWIGQFIRFLWKPNQGVRKEFEKIKMKHPIVGVHVRRTDKSSEAKFYNIENYMVHVEDWYRNYSLKFPGKTFNKTVYLATDTPKVLSEARKKYPDYEFIGDEDTADSAKTSSRYKKSSLSGAIKDVEMLSRCDYFVCTFSSSIGRIAYELMQTNKVDASQNYFSLDRKYLFQILYYAVFL